MGANQFNFIHETMIERWQYLSKQFNLKANPVHFACVSELGEELLTTHYISKTAAMAGIKTIGIDMSEIGYDENASEFVDLDDDTIHTLFKLYPWEDLADSDYSEQILKTSNIQFIEPSWKMLLSNKALLPKLYERFPDCPYLLKASFDKAAFAEGENYIQKSLFGREGEGIILHHKHFAEECLSPEKGYGQEGYIYQQYTSLFESDNNHAVLGVWVVGDQACGLGVREDKSRITKNTSMFVPHCFVP
jgi:glutathionylspermidine synthase